MHNQRHQLEQQPVQPRSIFTVEDTEGTVHIAGSDRAMVEMEGLILQEQQPGRTLFLLRHTLH